MKRSTAEQLINLFNVASKDETRRHLTGIYLEPIDDGSVRATATNGIALSTIVIHDDMVSWKAVNPFILGPEAKKMLQAWVKDMKALKREISDLTRLSSGNEAVNFVLCASYGTEYKLPILYRDYVKYSAILPTNPETTHTKEISFNVDELINLCKSLGKRKINTVTLQYESSMKPIIVKPIGTRNVFTEQVDTMLLMPVRR